MEQIFILYNTFHTLLRAGGGDKSLQCSRCQSHHYIKAALTALKMKLDFYVEADASRLQFKKESENGESHSVWDWGEKRVREGKVWEFFYESI